MISGETASVIRLADVKGKLFRRDIQDLGTSRAVQPPAQIMSAPVGTRRPPRQGNIQPVTRGAVREMLVMAVEFAFDRRLGRRSSPYLDQFDARYVALRNALDALESNRAAGDLRMVARRAEQAITAFFETFQSEVVVGVKPGMDADSPAFGAILARLKEAAVAAGGAAGYLEKLLDER